MWTSLKPLPKDYKFTSKPIVINDNEIIVFPLSNNCNYSSKTSKLLSSVKYSSIDNEWTEYIKYPKLSKLNFISMFRTKAAIDANNNIIWICNEGDKIAKIDLKSETWRVLQNKSPKANAFGSFSEPLIINEKYHLFGMHINEDLQEYSNQHITWSDELQKFISDKQFEQNYPSERMMIMHKIHYIESSKCIIIITLQGEIFKYCLINNKFTKLNKFDMGYQFDHNNMAYVDISVNFIHEPYICSIMIEKYIILFGNCYTCNIKIFNLETNKIQISKIKCPKKCGWLAGLTRDTNKRELIINGFINSKIVSKDLIKLITTYYSCDYVHLFTCYDESNCNSFYNEHWKITVDELLCVKPPNKKRKNRSWE